SLWPNGREEVGGNSEACKWSEDRSCRLSIQPTPWYLLLLYDKRFEIIPQILRQQAFHMPGVGGGALGEPTGVGFGGGIALAGVVQGNRQDQRIPRLAGMNGLNISSVFDGPGKFALAQE